MLIYYKFLTTIFGLGPKNTILSDSKQFTHNIYMCNANNKVHAFNNLIK